MFSFIYLYTGLEWNRVHYYCGSLLDYCSSPGWYMLLVKQVVDWMSCRGNWSTRRKPAPLPLCPPQIPCHLTWARTWAAVVVFLHYSNIWNCSNKMYRYMVVKFAEAYATSWKLTGPRHNKVNDFSNLSNPSSHTRPWDLLCH
jgi:hypothetical protein